MSHIHPLRILPPAHQLYDYTSDFRMSDEALMLLAETLCTYRPRSILEFGPGVSSYVICNYVKCMAGDYDPPSDAAGPARTPPAGSSHPVKYISIDHEGPFFSKFVERAINLNYSASHFWSVPVDCHGWYDLTAVSHLKLGEPFDLIVIDGPVSSPARNSDTSRAFLQKVIDPSSIVIVDDTHRHPESHLAVYVEDKILKASSESVTNVRDAVCKPRLTTRITNRVYPSK